MSARPASLYALAASFAVYLLPLMGPHFITILGAYLFRRIVAVEGGVAWIAVDTLVALLFQAIAFALFYLFLKAPGLRRGLPIAAAIPAFVVIAEITYLFAIPSLFLIEPDSASETGDWALECSARDATIVRVPMTHRRREAVTPEVLVQNSQGEYSMLRVPGCNVQKLTLPQPRLVAPGRLEFTLQIGYLIPGRKLLFAMQEADTGRQRWAYVTSGSTSAIVIDTSSRPILSHDATFAAWVETSDEASRQVIVKGRDEDRTLRIPLDGPASYEIVDVDLSAGELSVVRNDEYVVLDMNGRLKERLPLPEGVMVQSGTYLRTDSGWIAWDAYRDEGAYRIEWLLGGLTGTHRVLRGRSINAAAVSPSGNLIAVSVGSALNIGDIKDSVYVVRSRDGSEVFRRYLPRFTRTEVLFLSDELFAYSAEGQTHVLKVPEL